MAKEAIPFLLLFSIPAIAAAAAAAALGLWWLWPVVILFVGLTLFMAYFFRDPTRVSPSEAGIVVSPADGKVMVVERVDPADPASPTQVSIFLSPMDVHINYAPVAGLIEDVVHKPGRFEVASKKIASAVNEQNVITISNQELRVVARQIAGILARRIVCWKKAGDRVELGERFGLMKFSSRMDVVIPAGVDVLCREGERVVGAITIIGRKRPE
jgi:phosphatidylserine decarboxylase